MLSGVEATQPKVLRGIVPGDVRLDGYLAVEHLEKLNQEVEKKFQEVLAREDSYDLYRYYQHRDFRIAAGP